MIRKCKNQSVWLVGKRELHDNCVWGGATHQKNRNKNTKTKPNQTKTLKICALLTSFLSGLFSLSSWFLGILWCGIRKTRLRYRTEKIGRKRKGVLLLGLISERPLLWQIQVMGKEGRGLRSRDSNDPEL